MGLTVGTLVCSPWQDTLLRFQSKLICQIVDGLDLCELCIFEDVPIDGGVGESSALDRGFEAVAVAFHWERPVTPDGPTNPDTVSNMKQRMDGDWASGHAACVMLKVKSVMVAAAKLSQPDTNLQGVRTFHISGPNRQIRSEGSRFLRGLSQILGRWLRDLRGG